MKISLEDQRLLEDLCRSQGINYEKVLQLLAIEQKFEFSTRRTGIYDTLREVLLGNNIISSKEELSR